jgi:predicted transcriptional regulator
MMFTSSGRKVDESAPLGPLELAVLRILWSWTTAASVRDVLAHFDRPVAYTTIMTTMDRLFQKGLLERSGHGREAFLYRPLLKQEQWQRNQVRAFVSQCMTRSPSIESFLSGMIDALANHDESLLEAMDRQIEIYRARSVSSRVAGC